jgi:hypothetical protein
MAIIKPVTIPRTTDQQEIRKFFEQVVERISYQTYAGSPASNIVPRWIGDLCHDTTNSDWYKSTGITDSDWHKITP